MVLTDIGCFDLSDGNYYVLISSEYIYGVGQYKSTFKHSFEIKKFNNQYLIIDIL